MIWCGNMSKSQDGFQSLHRSHECGVLSRQAPACKGLATSALHSCLVTWDLLEHWGLCELWATRRWPECHFFFHSHLGISRDLSWAFLGFSPFFVAHVPEDNPLIHHSNSSGVSSQPETAWWLKPQLKIAGYGAVKTDPLSGFQLFPVFPHLSFTIFPRLDCHDFP